MNVVCLLVALLFACGSAAGGDEGDRVLGVWATAPGKNGRAHVEMSRSADSYSGTIVWLEQPEYPPDDPGGMNGRKKVDRNNPDEGARGNPIVGLRIVDGFTYAGDGEWKNGTIYDPENGKTYSCKMRLEGDDLLKVRGYVGISLLGRTTEWTRVKPGGN